MQATMAKMREAVEPIEEKPYSGFPEWYGWRADVGREFKSAKFLDDLVKMPVYVPHYHVKVLWRFRRHIDRLKAVIPGLLFVPCEYAEGPRTDEIMQLARIHGFLLRPDGHPRIIGKGVIEDIRCIEANQNLPPPSFDVTPPKVGDRVRLKSDLLNAWGIGTVVEVVSMDRIGVEFPGLFGRSTKVCMTASEIEPEVTGDGA